MVHDSEASGRPPDGWPDSLPWPPWMPIILPTYPEYLYKNASAEQCADALLLPLTPGKGLRRLVDYVRSLSETDPQISQALSLLEDHFEEIDDTEAVLEPLLWSAIRARLQSPHHYARMRSSLRDGSRLLAATEICMDTIFRKDALTEVVKATRGTQEFDSGGLNAKLQAAQEELVQVFPEEVVGVAIAIAVLVVADTMLIIEDVHMIEYIATH